METPSSSKRFHGLDTLRAIAIIIVLIYHYKVVVSRELLFGFFTNIGWVGVDLFFVLSGYLIGNQVLGAYARQENLSLKYFYARRLLRTLPNYYVVFSLYLLFPLLLSGSQTAPLWEFLTFTQNLNMRPGETFTHSWSLCVEEQFYILFPLICAFALTSTQSPARLWIVIGAGMLGAIAIRAYFFMQHGGAQIHIMDYYQHIYYTSLSRFDELLPGIAIALLKNYHPLRFEKLLRFGNHFLLAGIVGTAISFYLFLNFWYQEGIGLNLWISSFGYSLLAISFAALVMAALSPSCWLHRLAIPGAASLALWSYAIYLIHKPLFQLLKEQLNNANISTDGYWGMTIIMLVSIICGWLLYIVVETPFMKLRNKFFPSNCKPKSIPEKSLQAAP